jgi:two-component system, OmpR family, phosphate regulon sensor histidine kinase PhoR
MFKKYKISLASFLLATSFVVISFIVFKALKTTYNLEKWNFYDNNMQDLGKIFFSKDFFDKNDIDSLLSKYFSQEGLKNKTVYDTAEFKTGLKKVLTDFEHIDTMVQNNFNKQHIETPFSVSFYIGNLIYYNSSRKELIIVPKEKPLLLFGKETNTGDFQSLNYYQTYNTYFFNYNLRVNYPNLRSYIIKKHFFEFFAVSTVLLLVLIIVILVILSLFKQKKLSSMKKDFIDHITHELNTPLSTIQLAVSTLKKNESMSNDQDIIKIVNIIDKQNRKLQQTLNNVIDLNMMEKDHLEIKPELILLESIHEIISDLEIKYKEKNIEYHFDNTSLTEIYFDKYYFRVLMENIIDNAIKYSGKDVFILIRTEQAEMENIIYISDKGIGIPNKSISKVFNKFYRVGKTSYDVKGLGFGLYYARKIIKAHKGDIMIVPSQEGGTTIKLLFPNI